MLASGGYDATSGIHASAELYAPGTGQWCATASMGQNRYEHTATLLPDGQVLLTAGFSTASQYTSELFRPAAPEAPPGLTGPRRLASVGGSTPPGG